MENEACMLIRDGFGRSGRHPVSIPSLFSCLPVVNWNERLPLSNGNLNICQTGFIISSYVFIE